MRIAEYKPISYHTEQRTIHHDAVFDGYDNVIAEAYDEIVDVDVPTMGMVYRDATTEEIAEFERYQAEMPEPEPSPEERLAELEATTDDIVLLMAEFIGGE